MKTKFLNIVLLAMTIILCSCEKKITEQHEETQRSTVELYAITKLGSSFSYSPANSLVIDKNDNKWMGTWTTGILRYSNSKWTIYSPSNSTFPVEASIARTADDIGGVYFTAIANQKTYLVRCLNEKWSYWNLENAIKPDDVKFSHHDRKLYFTKNQSIYNVDIAANFEDRQNYHKVGNYSIRTGTNVKFGMAFPNIYLFNEDKTLLISPDGTTRAVSFSSALPGNTGIASGNSGNLYVISGQQIQKFNGSQNSLYSFAHEIQPYPFLRNLSIDKREKVYVEAVDPSEICKNCGVGYIENGKIKFIMREGKKINPLTVWSFDSQIQFGFRFWRVF